MPAIVLWWMLGLVVAVVGFAALLRWLMSPDDSWQPSPEPPKEDRRSRYYVRDRWWERV